MTRKKEEGRRKKEEGRSHPPPAPPRGEIQEEGRRRVHLCFVNIFVGAKHDRRQFISYNQRFTPVMLRPPLPPPLGGKNQEELRRKKNPPLPPPRGERIRKNIYNK
ncbi:MAG: hypothetical protein EAZ98_16075 [Oscillatoriales cyanobacterium]|nr:MAG: hypothetical protein EAZ98_16075 [Oscillatoriales cyanobacterium]